MKKIFCLFMIMAIVLMSAVATSSSVKVSSEVKPGSGIDPNPTENNGSSGTDLGNGIVVFVGYSDNDYSLGNTYYTSDNLILDISNADIPVDLTGTEAGLRDNVNFYVAVAANVSENVGGTVTLSCEEGWKLGDVSAGIPIAFLTSSSNAGESDSLACTDNRGDEDTVAVFSISAKKGTQHIVPVYLGKAVAEWMQNPALQAGDYSATITVTIEAENSVAGGSSTNGE